MFQEDYLTTDGTILRHTEYENLNTLTRKSIVKDSRSSTKMSEKSKQQLNQDFWKAELYLFVDVVSNDG
jgi:hypothetical protein